MLVDEKGRGIRYRDEEATIIYTKNVELLKGIYAAPQFRKRLAQRPDIRVYMDKIVLEGYEMSYYEPWRNLAKLFPELKIDLRMYEVRNQRHTMVGYKAETDIRYWQINAVKAYGNTVVSKDFNPEEIKRVFKEYGITVEVRDEIHANDAWIVEDKEVLQRRMGTNETHS